MRSIETNSTPSAPTFAPSPPLSARSGDTPDCEFSTRGHKGADAVSASPAPEEARDPRRRERPRRHQAKLDSSPASPTSVQPQSLPSAGSSFTSASAQEAPSNPTADAALSCPQPGHKGGVRDAKAPSGLRTVLCFIDQLRRGEHSASPHREHVTFALDPTSEYPVFREILRLPQTLPQSPPAAAPDADTDLDLDLDLLGRWAQDHLRWDYDSQRAVLTIRMPSPVHQGIIDKLKELLVVRFQAALETSGRGGEIDVKTGVEHIFREPEPEPQPDPPPGRDPSPQRTLPRRTRSGRDEEDDVDKDREEAEAEVEDSQGGSSNARTHAHVVEAVETSSASSPPGHEDGPTGHETVSSPDFGLVYTPPGGEEDYFPGFIVEVGYSHPLEDAAAKRYIRYSDGLVGYVMAFNVQYDSARRNRNILIHSHKLAWTEDTWFPMKCLDAYDVRAHAAALGPDNTAAEVDLGLRLSYLHDSLLPDDKRHDIPITLPLHSLITIVEKAYDRQYLHDKFKHDPQRRPTPRRSLIGKRARTLTPPNDLLQHPDAAYIDTPSRASFKKRRTGTKGE